MVGIILLLHIHHSRSKCGDDGSAYFNDNGMPQGPGGELRMAVVCAKQQKNCMHSSLPTDAQGPRDNDASAVFAFYGPSISDWCTEKVTDFSVVFQGIDVSRRLKESSFYKRL